MRLLSTADFFKTEFCKKIQEQYQSVKWNMRGSRNFPQGEGGGGQGQSEKKALTTFFFFLVLSLFYRSQKVNFKEIYHFLRFQSGYNIFQGGGGGPKFFRRSPIAYSL